MQVVDPLKHLRVTEVSTSLLGAHCGRLFADLGAKVSRIDASADSSLQTEAPLASDGGQSLLVPYFSHGKQTLEFDSSAADFYTRLDEVLRESDILIEDTWPGELLSGRASPEALSARHPQLIVISLSPFGRTGPYANWRGGELCVEAFGGFAYITGQTDNPPLKLAGNLFQYTTAVHGVTAGLSAVWSRQRDGAGRVVDLSAAQCVSGLHEWLSLYTDMGLVWQRTATPCPFIYPHAVFPCADGFFELGPAFLSSFEESQAAMATLLRDEAFAKDPRFLSWNDCYMNHQAMGERIRASLSDRKRDDLFAEGTALRICCGPVFTPDEVTRTPQLESRDFWKRIEFPSGSTAKAPGSPIRLWDAQRKSGRVETPEAPEALKAPGERPLAGLRVVDFTLAWAGPAATRVLAELGADVIRVGSCQYPWRATEYSSWPENDPGADPWNRQGYVLDKYLGKREIALDITQPRGRELLEELLAISDIFIENHSPRALRSMNLTYDVLAEKFPHLIMMSISGFGQKGPWGDYLSTGDVQEGLASLSYCTGYRDGDPERAGNTILDGVSGSVGAAAVLVALEYRARHGHGVYLDQSMLESSVSIFPEVALAAAAGGSYPIRNGSRHATRAPHDIYPCRGEDQWIAIDVDSEAAWKSLAHVLEREAWLEDERFASREARLMHSDDLDVLLSEATASHDKTRLAEGLQAAGVAASPVHDLRELVLHPHLHARGQVQKIRHPGHGNRTWLRCIPGQVEGFDLSIPRAAPNLGEHNEEILGDLLGVSEEELLELERKNIIGKKPLTPVQVNNLDLERIDDYPGIREHDPHYRERLGLDED